MGVELLEPGQQRLRDVIGFPLVDADIAVGANINADKIGTGVVDNTEFDRLNGITSAIEEQGNKGAISGYAGLDASQELLLTNFPAGVALDVLRRNAANTALEFTAPVSGEFFGPWTADHTAGGFDLLNVGGIQINNPLDTFQYIITPAAIVADRILNLPLMTATDTLVLEAFGATLTNKILALGSNTISGTAAQFDTAVTDDNFAFVSDNLSVFAATTSLQLAGVISDETGSGLLVFNDTPTIITPTIASFVNATHTHLNAAGGGTITKAAISDFAHQTDHQSGGSDALTGNLDATARTSVSKNSAADGGARSTLNFIEGSNITLTIIDDGAGEEVDITITSTAGGGSPLTTKGDVFGFDTADARVPVGTNDQVLMADSTAGLGVKYALVVDANIGTHTSTKITITAKGQLNSAIVYNDQANIFGDFDQTFKDNRLRIENPAGTFEVGFQTSAEVADRVLTIPLLGTNRTMVVTGLTSQITIGTEVTGASTSLTDTDDIAYLNQANTFGAFLNSFVSSTMRIPLSTTPTMAVDGDFAIDTDLGVDFSHGFIKYFDGEEVVVVGMPVAQFGSPADGEAVTYNSTTNEFELRTPAGAGDMVLADVQTVTGAKTFLDTTFLLRNPANTISLTVRAGAQTVARDATFPVMGGNRTIVVTSEANQIGDTEITAHTSTKITITAKSQLNSAIVYDDATTTYGAFLQDFAAASMRIPVSAAPTIAVNGDIGIDTTIADFTTPLIRYFGTESMVVVSVPDAQIVTPTGGHVITYNATTDEFELVAATGGEFTGAWTADHNTGGSVFSLQDARFADPTDNTKTIQLNLAGMTTAIELTISTSQSTARTLTIPNIGANRSFVVTGETSQIVIGTEVTGASTVLTDTADIAYLNTANTFIAGNKNTFAHSATTAGITVLPVAGNPSGQADGDMWLNLTTQQLFARINGVDVDLGAAGGGSQTPWLQDIVAGGFDLTDLSNILFRTTTGAPTATDRSIHYEDTEGMVFNALTGDVYRLEINGILEYSYSATTADFNSNNVTNMGTLNTHIIPGGTSTFAIVSDTLAVFAATTSLQLEGIISDETGSGGALVFASSPVIVTPTIASFTNATHDHTAGAGGGQLTNTALTSGVFAAITGLGTQTQPLVMGTNSITGINDLEFTDDVTLPASTVTYLSKGTVNLFLNVPTGDIFDFTVNAVSQMTINVSTIDFQGNTLTDILDITAITSLNGVAIGNYLLTTDQPFSINGTEVSGTVATTLILGTNILQFVDANQTITNNSGNLFYDIATGQVHLWRINNVTEMQLSATTLAMQGNAIIQVAFLTSFAADPSTVGTIRLGNVQSINWRNAGNTANFGITGDASDNISIDTNFDVNAFFIQFDEITLPGNPATNSGRLYIRDVATVETLFFLDSAGTETNVLTGTVGEFFGPWTANHDAGGFDLLNVGGIQINNPADTFQYIITPAAIAANRILNLPLMTGTDTFALEVFAATLTNKTMTAAANTFSGFAIGTEVTGASTDLTDTGVIVRADQTNVFGDFDQDFKDNRLRIFNPADSFPFTFVASAIASALNITLPLITVNTNMVVTDFANVWGTSNQNIAATGEWQEAGTAISPIGTHDDYYDAGMMVEVTSAIPDTVLIGTTGNRKGVLKMDFTAADEFATIKLTPPRNWDAGTITVILKWTTGAEGAGTVIWGVAGVAVADLDDLSAAATNYGTEITVTDTQTTINEEQFSPRTAAITLANTPVAGDSVYLKIRRDGATDTFPNIAFLLGIFIEWGINAATAT